MLKYSLYTSKNNIDKRKHIQLIKVVFRKIDDNELN